MENLNLHKLKMYSLVIAGVALIALFLNWITISFGGYSGGGSNGLKSWGLLSLIGVGAVIAACFMGDKTKDFDANTKKIVMGGFGAVALGALLFFLRINSLGGGVSSAVKTGLGLWICLAAGLAGLALSFGLIKLPNSTNTNKPL